MSDKQYVSQERYDEIEEELKTLKTQGRKEVADRLKEAKDLGDLSENSEYQEAKKERDLLEQKINKYENILRNAEIVKKSGSKDEVRIGSEVTIKKGRNKYTYVIVGSVEAEPSEGRISNESPIGKSLLGAKKGDKVEIKTPQGKKTYEVVDIS